MAHATRSGVAHFVAPDDATCVHDVRQLLSFLPSNNSEAPPWAAPTDRPDRTAPELDDLLPDHSDHPYDMTEVIAAVADDGYLFQYAPLWAQNIVCGLIRLDGHVVGVVANQPQVLAGVLDIDS
ncbi:MAG TPA: carboxyl transferase domain-containing protein, partial [Acidimicrobiales bacterium]|nr:carboxyl transferase domain-containing protein [Acidimicrobiales bacterium]